MNIYKLSQKYLYYVYTALTPLRLNCLGRGKLNHHHGLCSKLGPHPMTCILPWSHTGIR